MAFTEPKSVFFNEFAVPATINGTQNIMVIFDGQYLEVELVEGTDPQITVWDTDIPANTTNGDAVNVKGNDYLIVSIEPTGKGMGQDDGTSVMQLHLVP